MKRRIRLHRLKFCLLAKDMPPLSHWPDRSQPYDAQKSEVVRWMIAQPAILNALFHTFSEAKAIRFDPNTKTWSGAGELHEPDAEKPTPSNLTQDAPIPPEGGLDKVLEAGRVAPASRLQSAASGV